MKCCANCIDDSHLRKTIIPELSIESGTCSYCESSQQPLVNPTTLREHFELVTGIYNLNNGGKSLVEWLKSDWSMFTHKQMDDAHSKKLLADILDDGEIVQQYFEPSELCYSDTLDRWEAFRNELMHTNRFFPKAAVNRERLEELLSYLVLDKDDFPAKLYRARIQESNTNYNLEEMGAPPKYCAPHGRANPAGIPYLYVASTEILAISEIRPHTGEIASVANVSLPQGLKIADLRSPRKTVSPFMLADEDNIALLRGDIGFLEHLGEELTRPVLPKTAAIDYTPSQYLCEFVKNCGFDGITYRSAMGEGMNIALFRPDLATVKTVRQREVSRVSVELKDRYC